VGEYDPLMKRELERGIELDDDPARVDVDAVHRFLSEESYWARGRSRELVAELVRTADRVIGLHHGDRQIGFSRTVACDGAGLVYLADVYVLAEFRGRGFGIELVRESVERGPYAERRWVLHTADAHELYERFGFGPSPRLLERQARSRERVSADGEASS